MKSIMMIAATFLFAVSWTAAQPPGGGAPGGPPPGGTGAHDPGQAVLMALDADGNREISSAEIDNASAALRKLDSNGDGKLSDDDVTNAGNDRRGNRDQRGGAAGGGGRQGRRQGEGGAGRDRGRPGAGQFVMQAMQFDADGDGKLDQTELQALAQQLGPPTGGAEMPAAEGVEEMKELKTVHSVPAVPVEIEL